MIVDDTAEDDIFDKIILDKMNLGNCLRQYGLYSVDKMTADKKKV